MMTPMKYFKELIQRVFSDKGARVFERGIEVESGLAELAWDEIHTNLYGDNAPDAEVKTPSCYISPKLVIINKLSDYAYEELNAFLAKHKFDTSRDYEGNIEVKMSVRKR